MKNMSIVPVFRTMIGNEETNSVNAREIHAFLGVKTHLSTWINRAIEKYDFQEGYDFSILKSGNPNGGIAIKDYIVTIDMAKELAMLENNPKGKEIRKYFIEVEKSARAMLVNVGDMHTTVEKYVKRAMTGVSFTPNKRRVGTPLSDEEKAVIDDLYSEYWSIAAIARDLGCDAKTVSRHINAKMKSQQLNLFAYEEEV